MPKMARAGTKSLAKNMADIELRRLVEIESCEAEARCTEIGEMRALD